MTLVLPVSVAGDAAGWTLVTWTRYTLSTPAAAGGSCSLSFDQLDGGELWLVDHAVISCTSSTDTELRLYEGEPATSRLLDGSDVGNFGVADWPQGLLVEPSRQLVAQWTGASAGAVGTLRVQVRVFRRS